jgi:glycosyltransferase involved in cell wall biosynthesis
VEVITLRSWGDFSPDSIWSLVRIVRTKPIDLICTNWEKDLRLGGIASLCAGVPIVPSREVDVPIKNTWVNRLFYRHIASAVLVNSFATRRTLLKSAPWLKGKQVRVIWKGTENRTGESIMPADLRHQFHLCEGDVIAGFVGRLDEQKGVSTLLEAMRLVARRDTRLKLVLAGEGNLHTTIEQYIRKHGLEKHIFMTGFMENVTPLLKAFDFLVMPSNWEGFGYSAIEGMAMGKAIIGTTSSSLPEIIKDGETGILVPPRSPGRLADAMENLSIDATRRASLGESGLKRATDYFSLSAMINKTETFFLDIASPSYQVRRPLPKFNAISH